MQLFRFDLDLFSRREACLDRPRDSLSTGFDNCLASYTTNVDVDEGNVADGPAEYFGSLAGLGPVLVSENGAVGSVVVVARVVVPA